MILSMATLRNEGVPEELANRMSVAHGSRQLLRALRGEPEPVEPPCRPMPKLRPPKCRTPYVAVPQRPRPQMPDPVRRIVKGVAAEFGLSLDELCGKERAPYLVHARAVAYRLLRDRAYPNGDPRTSLPRIGAYFGRDHSTICYGLANFDNYVRFNPDLGAAYERLRERLA